MRNTNPNALKKGKNAKNAIMSVLQLKTSLYRHGNFVFFRGTKRDRKSYIYKSLLLISNKEHCTRYKKLSF